MKQVLDTVWQRRGMSWVWDDDASQQVARASEVCSLRQLMLATRYGRTICRAMGATRWSWPAWKAVLIC